MTRSEAFSSEVTDKLFEVLDVSKLGIHPCLAKKNALKPMAFEEEEFRCPKMELVDFFQKWVDKVVSFQGDLSAIDC